MNGENWKCQTPVCGAYNDMASRLCRNCGAPNLTATAAPPPMPVEDEDDGLSHDFPSDEAEPQLAIAADIMRKKILGVF
jgi:hypothetical protein